MIRVLLDTSVWISYLRIRENDTDGKRHKKANELFNYLQFHKKLFEICYSEWTRNELNNDEVLVGFTMLGSHCFNLPINEIDLVWNNINTKWGDESEVEYGGKLEELLPNTKKKNNKKDRGIFGDSVYEDCNVIIHEDKDFDRFKNEALLNGILSINLLDVDLSEAIYNLKERKKINE